MKGKGPMKLKSITFRVSEALWQALAEAAKRNERSMAAELRLMLRERLRVTEPEP